ncbi:MAG: hypothetical protein HYU36_05825 [Planctomycetes bacterium]|nr:hypothetical protein [Planctomycetota bacterium]
MHFLLEILVLVAQGLNAAPPLEEVINLARTGGKPCHFGSKGEAGVLTPLTFTLPEALPPGAYSLRFSVRTNGKGGSFQLGSLVLSAQAWPAGMTEEEAVQAKKMESFASGPVPIGSVPAKESAPLLLLSLPPAESPRQVRVSLEIDFDDETEKLYLKEQSLKLLRDRPPEMEGGGVEGPREEEGEAADEFEVQTVDLTRSDAGAVAVTRAALQSLYRRVCLEDLVTDRIVYDPGAEGKAVLRLWNFSEREVAGRLRVHLERRLNDRETLADVPITLEPKERRRLEFPFRVGEDEMGHGCVAAFESDEETVARRFAFSVARDVYRVAFHARPGGTGPMFVPLWWDRAECLRAAEAAAESNLRSSINLWEEFAWAPSDFEDLTPEEEAWASGQTQYRKTQTCLKAFIETFKRYGIRSIAYGNTCGEGVISIAHALRRPDLYHTFSAVGFCHEQACSVDVLDRMREGRYRIHGLDEDHWSSPIYVWTQLGNPDAYEFGSDEIIASAKRFGWDGVRFDGHYTYWNDDTKAGWMVRHFARRIRRALPGFSIGYNFFTDDKAPRVWYRTNEEFKACAEGGGMMMNEYYRGFMGNVRPNVAMLQIHGDETRRAGGYFLCITDTGGDLNAALCLAAGARIMGDASTSARSFATRYSAYVLDETNRRLQQPRRIVEADPPVPFFWDGFIYEKEESPEKSLLIFHLVNVNPDLDFGGKNGPARNLNPPMKNFTMRLRLPEGCSLESVFATGPEDEWMSQDVVLQGDAVTIPRIALWTMAVLAVRKPLGLSFSAICEDPLTDEEQKQIQEKEEHVRKFNESLVGRVAAPRDHQKGRWRDRRTHREEVPAVPGAAPPPPPPRRNGLLDVLHFKGIFYHLHRVDEALARFDAFSLQEALLENGGTLKELGADNPDCILPVPTPDALVRADVLILDDVPASAMSFETRLKILRYVEGGGGLLLLGGWYTLDKGQFEGSLLEDLLPCETLQHHTLVRLDAPAVLAPGPDEMPGLDLRSLDFDSEPRALWCNNVLPRAGAQVLMGAAEQPALVAGNFGRGRVLVIPLATSGEFPPGQKPYWQWNDWPVLLERCIRHLAGDFLRIDPLPRGIPDDEAEKLLLQLDELEGNAALQALQRLRLHRQPDTAREIARYVAQYELADPELQEEILDEVVAYADKTWSDVAEKLLQRIEPSLLRAGVAILLRSEKKPDLSVFQGILNQLEPSDRAKLYARSADPRHLPLWKAHLAGVLEREKFFEEERVSPRARPHLMRDQSQPRLEHPFAAAAAFRCGGGPDAAYEFARGVYHLFFYAWRERWIHEGKILELVNSMASAQAIRRAAAHGLRQRARFEKEADRALDLLLEDLEKLKPEALRAMLEIDCHKSMKAVYRIFARLRPADWALVAPLVRAPYEPVREVALQFVQRHGGEEGRRQVSEKLVQGAQSAKPAAHLFALKHLDGIVPEQRLAIIVQALRQGGAEVYEAALGRALALPETDQEQAISAAREREDFFARRIRRAWKVEPPAKPE